MADSDPKDDDFDRVVLITVDSLRADFMDRYSALYGGVWIPAVAPATATPQSHASLFTGLRVGEHGVRKGGDTLRTDDLLSGSHSIAFSSITKIKQMTGESALIKGIETDSRTEQSFVNLSDPDLRRTSGTDQICAPEFDHDYISAIREHELTFLHDMVVHSSSPEYSVPWGWTADRDSVRENRQRYRRDVDLSLSAHRRLLSELRDAGLLSSTLFVLVSDHGQLLGEYGEHGHARVSPYAGASIVPVGFALPGGTLPDELGTSDLARLIDVAPTLATMMDYAGLRIDGFSHSPDGVDMLETDATAPDTGYIRSASPLGLYRSGRRLDPVTWPRTGRERRFDTVSASIRPDSTGDLPD